MKQKRRLTALLMAALMLFALCGSAFASGEASGEANAAVSITSTDVATDETYFSGEATENTVSDFTISADNENVTGIYVSAESAEDTITIQNGRIELVESGTAISLSGDSSVLIDSVVIWNRGNADGISAAGSSVTTVTNSVIYGAQDPETYRRASPFALGLAGSMRVTNAVETSQITYEDSVIVSGSWAALSTDSGTGVVLTARNVLAGVGSLEVAQDGVEYTATKEVNGVTYGFTLGDSANYNSGYVSYCDSGFHNYYYDSQLYGTDYVIILSTSESSATLVNDEMYSNRIGIMWHKNGGGTVDITDGSLYAEYCLFQMKGYSSTDTDGCQANLVVDGTELTVGEGGILLQLMTSDDCGLDYEALQVPEEEDDLSQVECLLGTQVQKTYSDGFPPTTYYVYEVDGEEVGYSADELDTVPEDAVPVMVDYEPQEACTAIFSNLSVEGDVYNGVWEAYQALDVTFDNAVITGVISSSYANHVDAEGNILPGGTVIEADSTLDCHLGIGRLTNTAAAAINNPVYLTLENGAEWVVTGVSYLSQLTVDETSTIIGIVTVDGEEVDTTVGGVWEGEIVVVPAA
ncbi:MAG: hypothetical protein LUE21_03465 [Oscillospiraceae bacterium]|nr:hypothetical protein [Oscillospiraceae bacterium]